MIFARKSYSCHLKGHVMAGKVVCETRERKSERERERRSEWEWERENAREWEREREWEWERENANECKRVGERKREREKRIKTEQTEIRQPETNATSQSYFRTTITSSSRNRPSTNRQQAQSHQELENGNDPKGARQLRGSILASYPVALVQIRAFPKKFRWKMINVAEVNRRRCLEESGQWLENVDQTHLLLASEKPVLQKRP